MSLAKALKELQEKVAEDRKSAGLPPEPEKKIVDPNAERVADVGAALRSAGADTSYVQEVRSQEERYGKGILVGRIFRAIAACRQLQHSGVAVKSPMHVLRDMWGDKVAARMMEHAQEMRDKQLSAGVPSEGGYLIPEVLSDDFIELLRAKAVMGMLGMRVVPMPRGNMTIPRLVSGATFAYVAENVATNASQPSFGDVKYTARTLVGIIPASNELLRYASPQADQIIRDDAAKGFATKVDQVGLVGQTANDEPLGCLVDPAATDVAVNAVVTADLATNFIVALLNANVSLQAGSFGWVFNPTIWQDLYDLKDGNNQYYYRAELDRGRFTGFPYGISSQIPNGGDAHAVTRVGFGDFSEYIFAQQGAMEVDASFEAAYNDSGGNVVSAYSRNQTVIRVRGYHDMRLRQAAAFAKSDDVYTIA